MLITQHSGAIILPASVGVRLIITDSFPYYIGSYSKNDIVLFKPIYYKSERLSLEQILSEHSHVIYGEGVGDGEYEIGFNSEDEICNAVKGKCLVKKSFPLDTLIYYQDNYLVDF